MVKYKVSEFFVKQIKSLTIEPLIFLYSFGLCVTSGAQITTNLLIWKICRDRLEYSEETCGNLTLEVITHFMKSKEVLTSLLLKPDRLVQFEELNLLTGFKVNPGKKSKSPKTTGLAMKAFYLNLTI
jgi:hypothetical protein